MDRADPHSPLTSTGTSRGVAARLVREYLVEPIGNEIHGVAFDGKRLILAGNYWLLRIAPDGGRIIDQFETFPERGGIAYDGRYVWQHSEGKLQKLDERTGYVLRTIEPKLDEIVGLECSGDDLLVLHAGGRALARVETLNARAVATLEVEGGPLRGLAWDGRELWSATKDELVCLDLGSGRILARAALAGDLTIVDIAWDDQGHIWCVDGRSRLVRAFARPRTV